MKGEKGDYLCVNTDKERWIIKKKYLNNHM